MKQLRWWWGQPDHYDWFSSYLQLRRMAGVTRLLAAMISLTLVAIPFAMLWSAAPPDSGMCRVLAGLSIAGGVSCAVLWTIRWPTKRGSITVVVVATGSIAMGALAQSDPTMAIVACAAFATVSGYIAVFHDAYLLSLNTIVVVLVPIVPALALAPTQGVIQALSEYGVVLVVNIAVPFGIQLLIHMLGVDLLQADRDPLTGLLNRRAFYQRTRRLVAAQGQSDSCLVVVMIDLDRFKLVNDSQGHAAGDRALIAVGRAVREHARQSAIVARVGGEEFLVADVYTRTGHIALGQRLCDAVAGLPYAITASVGSASARCDRILTHANPPVAITALIEAADEAMYEAKRNGGNQSRDCTPIEKWLS